MLVLLVGKGTYFYFNNKDMKELILSFLCIFPAIILAQPSSVDVVMTEKSFAAYSVQNGTKAAFLKFADSAGIVFEQGKAVNAIETWKNRENRPGVLNWRPLYALTAASGDLAFTTGPWTFQPKTVQDSVVARGQYSTVWHKTPNGEWKFLLDMGVGNTPVFDSASFNFKSSHLAFTPGSLEDLQKAEEAFVQNTNDPAARTKAYTDAVSKQAFLLNRNGRLPATVVNDIPSLVKSMPETIGYKQMNAGIARSGDLGYVYGTASINSKESNYLHIWRREGSNWKLVLEVLQY